MLSNPLVQPVGVPNWRGNFFSMAQAEKARADQKHESLTAAEQEHSERVGLWCSGFFTTITNRKHLENPKLAFTKILDHVDGHRHNLNHVVNLYVSFVRPLNMSNSLFVGTFLILVFLTVP